MIETVVDSIRVSLVTQHRVVLLKEVHGDRHLPIWIGPFEAEAIAMALQGMTPARPLPYDLLRTIIDELGAEIREVAVTDLSQEIFYARIVLTMNGRTIEIDSRPSDAIALAVRAKVPIYVDESVMERAGVRLEAEEESEGEGEVEPPEIERVESEERISEADLSVFREVIESLDLDDLDKK
ncbi:bifunctional nuclease family protein [Thermomicrobium sp. 4228-Ro]|uniref:bifunctional nuclease family protein n=1 Tax=Thermomicrobium sp. 4228-Ro TaxID=2993937 RepID=UPI002248E07F|nr:bifunctional nuclease family protein [Thermomicrobium sp. 4228-Ro]MCX2726123.1 bifunctional nuclease family protein [Thermomicrobium sp. 4228-Ro]